MLSTFAAIGGHYMTRDEILAAAQQCISNDRNRTYGDASTNFANIAALWQAYLDGLGGKGLIPRDVAAMMALFKIGRALTSPYHEDNWVDGAAYLALAGEISTNE